MYRRVRARLSGTRARSALTRRTARRCAAAALAAALAAGSVALARPRLVRAAPAPAAVERGSSAAAPSLRDGTRAPAAAVPAPLVDLRDVAPGVLQELRYASADNLTGAPLPGYRAGRCWLLPAAATALARVQRSLEPYGLGLKVFDCYRPQRAVTHLQRWSQGGPDAYRTERRDYLPRLRRQDVFRAGYFSSRSRHSRGATVDLTLVPAGARVGATQAARPPCHYPAPGALRDGELDMGTGFDCLDAAAHTASLQVGPQARAARLLLVHLMRQAGFVNYAREWWHFTLVDADATQAFDWPIE